jgi:hypothetical protein
VFEATYFAGLRKAGIPDQSRNSIYGHILA